VRPDVIVTANPGCLLQIGKHLASGPGEGPLPLLHPVQLLDASIRNVPVPRT
jgi:glycolate oxidase iron-sulfur subunit